MSKLIIPSIAAKYILLQRTAYISLQKNYLFRIISKLLGLNNYKRRVIFESFIRRKKIISLYINDIGHDFKTIKDDLPTACHSILDIGCGVAGIDVLLNNYFKDEIKFYLLDKTHIENNLYYGFEDKGTFYNSLRVSKRILQSNNISDSNIVLIEAEDNELNNITDKIDLVISFISWGFHYPVAYYLDSVYKLMNEEAYLIIDIRKNTSGLDELKKYFKKVKILYEENKFQRILCIKDKQAKL